MASYSYVAPPVKHTSISIERIEKFISTVYFTDVNLQSRVVRTIQPCSEITHYAAPGRFDFEKLENAQFVCSKVGESFGPLWSTHWFRVTFYISTDFSSSLSDQDEVLFNWDSGCEATLWSQELRKPIAAFSTGSPFNDSREFFPVTDMVKSTDRLEFLIETACNTVLGQGEGLFIGPPNTKASYQLKKCQLVVQRKTIVSLIRDLQILTDIAKELGTTERGLVALYTANQIVNILQSGQGEVKYQKANKFIDEFFSHHNTPSQHSVYAVGHCHMDCAWLWPYEETKRKCARSWASTLHLMSLYPDWKFACSSVRFPRSEAQQYEWVQQHYPHLFNKIKETVKTGRFIPVGGSWVEMDGYIPSGESMCRQLLYGQRYFLREFDILCTEFWLPDTFGYSAQLPQIMSHFGMKRFFTQKLSWSLFNKFPHHTFNWQGLDGTKVLTHFAPGESYHMRCTVPELVKTLTNFKDKGRSKRSLYLFGHGDGGQGPTAEMLENLKRLKDVEGLPKVEFSSPAEYFETVEDYELHNLCTWSGELYLEMHNGTYTTQSDIKSYNRKCEMMLHNIEFICTVNYLYNLTSYPYESLDKLWKVTMLNQFHDILPGSSIEIVHQQAKDLYKKVVDEGTELYKQEIAALLDQKAAPSLAILNTLSWPRVELVTVSLDMIQGLPEQYDLNGRAYQLVTCDGLSVSAPGPISFCTVNVEKQGEIIYLSNSRIYAELDIYGRVMCLKTKQLGIMKSKCEPCSRNLLRAPANQFVLYNDIPLFWDAWDTMEFHQETRTDILDTLCPASITEEGPLRACVEVKLKISDRSYLRQTIILDAESPYIRIDCEVHWYENRMFLKVEFPCDVITDHVTYESQFGFIRRSNSRNTSWDTAKYEVCSLKWFDISDYNAGVSILNKSKYGCSVIGSTLSVSLLRSPKYPDANCDMGANCFTYAIMPHKGSFQDAGVVQAAYSLNNPLEALDHQTRIEKCCSQLFVCSDPSIIIDTIKAAECDREREDNSSYKHIVLRCYESHGGSCTAEIEAVVPLVAAYECDGLEREQRRLDMLEGASGFLVSFTPHQFKTIKITTESSPHSHPDNTNVNPGKRQTAEDKRVLTKSLSRRESFEYDDS